MTIETNKFIPELFRSTLHFHALVETNQSAKERIQII